MKYERKKPLLCLASLSGVGKTTVLDASPLDQLISYTTRALREGEIDGIEYHFVDVEWMQSNRNLFTLDYKPGYNEGEIYGAQDKCLLTKDAMTIFLRDAIGLRQAGVPVHIIWIDGPVRETRANRKETPVPYEMIVEHADSIIHNTGTIDDAVQALMRIYDSV